jgi:hypothetical protein
MRVSTKVRYGDRAGTTIVLFNWICDPRLKVTGTTPGVDRPIPPLSALLDHFHWTGLGLSRHSPPCCTVNTPGSSPLDNTLLAKFGIFATGS